MSNKDIQNTRHGIEFIATAPRERVIGAGGFRSKADAANDNAKPCASPGTRLRAGDRVEVRMTDGASRRAEYSGAWWAGAVSGMKKIGGRIFVRVRMDAGAPVLDAVLTSDTFGRAWRVSTLAVHHVPLTGQGVRNLNLAAPPANRNGRRARTPAYGQPRYMVICNHAEEDLGEAFEEPIFWADPWFPEAREQAPHPDEPCVLVARWIPCVECGAEIPDGRISFDEWSKRRSPEEVHELFWGDHAPFDDRAAHRTH